MSPAYIKGYPPGIRENGDHYTHGALWSILAPDTAGKSRKSTYRLFSMINPIYHSVSLDSYRVESYVVAADVYSVKPAPRTRVLDMVHRFGKVGILPCGDGSYSRHPAARGTGCFVNPVLPREWSGYKARWQFEKAVYHIMVEYKGRQEAVYLGGKIITDAEKGIPLEDSGEHEILVILSLKPVKS